MRPDTLQPLQLCRAVSFSIAPAPRCGCMFKPGSLSAILHAAWLNTTPGWDNGLSVVTRSRGVASGGFCATNEMRGKQPDPCQGSSREPRQFGRKKPLVAFRAFRTQPLVSPSHHIRREVTGHSPSINHSSLMTEERLSGVKEFALCPLTSPAPPWMQPLHIAPLSRVLLNKGSSKFPFLVPTPPLLLACRCQQQQHSNSTAEALASWGRDVVC